MNQPAQNLANDAQESQKKNPPSRRTKEELKDIAETLQTENEQLLAELAELRKQKAESGEVTTNSDDEQDGSDNQDVQGISTTDGVDADYKEVSSEEQGEIDPVTGERLTPALSAEEVAQQDSEITSQYEDMMDVDGSESAEPVQAIETNKFESLAKNSPVAIRPSMETDERDTGHHGKIQEFSDNRIDGDNKLVEHARSEDVIAMDHKQQNINFMKMLVTIHIMQGQNADDDMAFSIGVNGRQWNFERNKEYTVPRYVVEGLLRAKPMHYSNEEYTKDNGERSVRWPIRQGVRYPFAIVEDKYPKWREWMAFTMAQPD